jgi:flagellar motility protein MotE (MotC chaperone)
MKNLAGALVKAYAAVAAYAVGLVLVERLRDSVRVLRTPPARVPERPSAVSEEEGRDLERTQRQRQETLALREHALRELEARLTGELAQLRGEREELERERKKLRDERALTLKDQEAAASAKSDAEVAANLPILSKMDGPGIVSVLKSWDDARFVRYLRAMKPSKAAEVLETIRTDPQFEQEFRRVPEDAPPGAKPRAEQLVEEFKRVP